MLIFFKKLIHILSMDLNRIMIILWELVQHIMKIFFNKFWYFQRALAQPLPINRPMPPLKHNNDTTIIILLLTYLLSKVLCAFVTITLLKLLSRPRGFSAIVHTLAIGPTIGSVKSKICHCSLPSPLSKDSLFCLNILTRITAITMQTSSSWFKFQIQDPDQEFYSHHISYQVIVTLRYISCNFL